MNIWLVRHATLIVQMDGSSLLVDPMLSKKGHRTARCSWRELVEGRS
jgi:L-ascorbate metabolism protein UlaG (beta-lactamase superfamily)